MKENVLFTSVGDNTNFFDLWCKSIKYRREKLEIPPITPYNHYISSRHPPHLRKYNLNKHFNFSTSLTLTPTNTYG